VKVRTVAAATVAFLLGLAISVVWSVIERWGV